LRAPHELGCLASPRRLQQCGVMTQQNGNPVVARSARRRRCSAAHSRLAGAQLWSTEMLRAFVFAAVVRPPHTSSSSVSSFGVPRCTAWCH